MKLLVQELKKGTFSVKCPRIEQMVEVMHTCSKCMWLSIIADSAVRCRWTQEKEDLKTGRRYYETS